MEKLTENDLIYFYRRHVVLVVIAVTTISLTPVKYCLVCSDFILPCTCIIAGMTCQPITSSIVPSSACSLMEKATCSSPIYRTSCVIGFTDFNVILSQTNVTDCKGIRYRLTGLEDVLTDLRRTSNYIGITDKFDHEDACISKSCGYYMTPDGTLSLSATLGNGSPKNSTERDKFPRTTSGLVVMYLSGMLTGILVTSLVFVLYIRWLRTQSSKQENTYLDLDLSGEGEDEEKPHERGQRGSVAFVREIASVYFNQVGNEIDHTGSTRSRLFSKSSLKSGKFFPDRKPSQTDKDPNDKKSTKQLYTYEQSVPEEIPDCINLDSPTNHTGNLKYQNESIKCESNKDGNLTNTTDDIQGNEEQNVQEDGEWGSEVESTVECQSMCESTVD